MTKRHELRCWKCLEPALVIRIYLRVGDVLSSSLLIQIEGQVGIDSVQQCRASASQVVISCNYLQLIFFYQVRDYS